MSAGLGELAHAFETKLIRGFSFYPPRGDDPWKHLPQAVDQIGQIAETCHRSDLTFGLEIEMNLVGRDGPLLAELHRQVNHPALLLVFDAANLVVQGFSTSEVFAQYQLLKPAIGWMHIKDYRHPPRERGEKEELPGRAREAAASSTPDAASNYVPLGMGQSGYEAILRDFRESLPALEKRLRRRGIPGVFLDLEPHLKMGGQFGGSSGPDGMGLALRSLLRVLDFIDIGYHLRDLDDVRASRVEA